MFASMRSYGFPKQYIVISKETDSLEEAQRVYTLSTIELLREGWQIKITSIAHVVMNVSVYFICSTSLVSVLYASKKKVKKE